jgi:hypothetical protein
MLNDMLWAPRFTGSEYVMKTRGNEEYTSKIIKSKKIWYIVMMIDLCEN